MKVKIKSFYGELPEYLTRGKVYEVDSVSSTGFLFWAKDDEGELDCFLFNNCDHLSGGSWEIVE